MGGANLEGLARLAELQKRWERVARLLAAAATIRERIGAPLAAVEATSDSAVLAKARTRLGKSSFMAAWEVGGRLSVEQAVDEALEP